MRRICWENLKDSLQGEFSRGSFKGEWRGRSRDRWRVRRFSLMPEWLEEWFWQVGSDLYFSKKDFFSIILLSVYCCPVSDSGRLDHVYISQNKIVSIFLPCHFWKILHLGIYKNYIYEYLLGHYFAEFFELLENGPSWPQTLSRPVMSLW